MQHTSARTANPRQAVLVNAPLGVKVERAFQLINNKSGHSKARHRDLAKITGTLRKQLDSVQRIEDAARLGTTDAGSTSAGGNRTSKRGELGAQPQSACEVAMIRIEHIKSRLGAWRGVKTLSREFISFGSTVSWSICRLGRTLTMELQTLRSTTIFHCEADEIRKFLAIQAS